MSGRGRGGKGLGAFRPNISEQDARNLLVDLLPKTYKTKLRMQDITYSKVSSWLDMIFSNDDYMVSEVREEVPYYLNIKTAPSKIKITSKDIDRLRTTYQKCVQKFLQQSKQSLPSPPKQALPLPPSPPKQVLPLPPSPLKQVLPLPPPKLDNLLSGYNKVVKELNVLNDKLDNIAHSIK